MEPEPFKPSIDWAAAPMDSLIWIAKAWAISAVCALVVVILIRYLTSWGRQYWRITRGYFIGRQSVSVWAWLGVLLLSVVLSVRLTVLFSFQANDLYTGLQKAFEGMAAGNVDVKNSGIHGFYVSLGVFSVMALMWIVLQVVDMYITQRFIVRWRIWLTGHLTGNWLDGRAYYRGRFIDGTIDNPDQRIQQDVDVFTAGVGGTPNEPSNGSTNTLLFGAINAVLSVISFAAILWHLSGTLIVWGISIPKALFWVVLAYVFIASVFAFWIGRPLIRFSFLNEMLNAAFRYALVRLRDAAEAVGFYRGERAERIQLQNCFSPIIDNYRRFVLRTLAFTGWNFTMTQVINPLPWVVQAPRLFKGQINFGDVGQSATAFGNIHDSLSFFRNAYDRFASFRAAIIRVHGLVDADDRARELPTIAAFDSGEHFVELKDVEVRTPAGTQLIDPLNVRLNAGEGLVITGQSGSGKTTLLRSLAQLWPFASGTLVSPAGENETMFLSQLPYVPLGDLRAVVSYPSAPGDIPDDRLQETLTRVALPHLVGRLDETADWAKVMSPGEQQRVAFARILLT